MLNTQNLISAVAVLGSCSLALARQNCVVTTDQVHTLPLTSEEGMHVSKLRAGVVLTPGVNELLALEGTNLWLVRDVMSAPRRMLIASEVADFAVLPALQGVSRVIVVGPEGLRISSVIDDSSGAGSTLDFGTLLDEFWDDVTLLECANAGDATQIAGAAGSLLRRGKWNGDDFQASNSLQAEGAITQIAVADGHSEIGVEYGLVTNAGMGLYFETSAIPYVFLPAPAGSILSLSRIPSGAGVRDSFGLWVRDPVMDIFAEVVEAQFSPAIYSGGARVQDVSYGAIGITFQPQISILDTDMVVATQTNELVALHGIPQVPAGYPFWMDPTQFWTISVQALLPELDLADLRVACADFDGDGDGDLAIANNHSDDTCLAFVRNDCTYADAEPLVAPYIDETPPSPDFLPSPFEMGVETPLEVRQPPIFDGVKPTHVRVRVMIREYYDGLPPGFTEMPPVSPEAWWESAPMDLAVLQDVALPGSTAPHSSYLSISDTTVLPLSIVTQAQLTTANVLAYFEFVPMIKDANNVVVQRANATVWVGAVSSSSGLLQSLICEDEPDSFSALYPCSSFTSEDTGQLITEMHRRQVIRPIPPSPVPQ